MSYWTVLLSTTLQLKALFLFQVATVGNLEQCLTYWLGKPCHGISSAGGITVTIFVAEGGGPVCSLWVFLFFSCKELINCWPTLDDPLAGSAGRQDGLRFLLLSGSERKLCERSHLQAGLVFLCSYFSGMLKAKLEIQAWCRRCQSLPS